MNALNTSPFEALTNIQEDVTSMKLAPYLDQQIPNIMKYILLPDEEQEAILKLLEV